AIGLFQVNGLAGSVTAVPTNSNILSQLIAGPWPVPNLGTPATAKQPINVSLREFHQSGLLLNGDPESSGCTGFDPGNPKVDLAALMAPVQTTETFTDANGNPITSQ